ncbi:MAG: heme lyase CcmF/NrfE family subunit [Calditrichaceae bacterium]|nr:heme lyase CcmF/NrfE family subunit [Calditrichaceae bacterium]MBN2709389.1 heme lyase CcmF/NrfE family subunit [Calditrichaceae bacterium]
MIAGISATSLTFIALFISIPAYYFYYRRKDPFLLSTARVAFYTATGLIFFQAVLLMMGILNYRFDWVYVFSYSSRDLPLYYLISTFWAGQEGTFLLWLFLGSIYGLYIIKKNKEEEPLVLSFMNMVMAFITMILVKKNPFTYVWELNPQAFAVGQIPVDGNGLNPLLQDPWMVIHPPVLFAGYSSTMILFAFALSALVKRNYDNWIKTAYPYALFVGVTLGAGIILGGYWAYTTLGWGGYWGWDPVENSSLIPWFASLALIHGILIQKKQGGLKKTNIFLALVTFVLVLYGTFLTRSGVLTDFSVHTFGSSELDLYLSGFVALFLGISVLLFLFRVRDVEQVKVTTGFFTKETFLFWGMLILLVMAFITLIGTSSPILTGLFTTASNVSTDYYNKIAGPFAILLALFIGISPVLRWKESSEKHLKTLLIHFIVSLFIGIIAYIIGVRSFLPIVITFVSVFMILVNGQYFYYRIRKKNHNYGGYLSHIGVGLMIIGIVASSVYDKAIKVTLPIGSPKEAFGYVLTYHGKEASPDGKDKVIIKIDDKTTHAKFYWSEYSRAYMVAPAVQNTLLHDFYISPIQIINPGQNVNDNTDVISLKKGEDRVFEKMVFHFSGYDMDNHQMAQGDVYLAAVISIKDESGKLLNEIRPAMTMKGEQRSVIPALLPGTERKIIINGISVENSMISLAIDKGEQTETLNSGQDKEMLAVEVSVKPLINLLWLGTIILVIGFSISVFQYKKQDIE